MTQDVLYHVAGPIVRMFPVLDPRHTAKQFCVRCGAMLREHCWPGYDEGAVIAIGPNWQAIYLGDEPPSCDVKGTHADASVSRETAVTS